MERVWLTILTNAETRGPEDRTIHITPDEAGELAKELGFAMNDPAIWVQDIALDTSVGPVLLVVDA